MHARNADPRHRVGALEPLTRRSHTHRVLTELCRLLVAGGLALDAYVHVNLAYLYDGVRSALSEGDLFRIEAGVASAAALAILVLRNRVAPAVSAVVAASAIAALIVSYAVNLGPLGPIPDMYETAWYAQKSLALAGEGMALVASVLLLALSRKAPHS